MGASEALSAYLEDQRQRGLTPSTIERRRATLWSFRIWLRGQDRDLLDAGPDDIRGWLKSRRGFAETGELHPRTRYAYLSTLSCFYEYAIEIDETDVDPAGKIRRPKLPQGLPRPIDTDDLVLALRNADDVMRAMLTLGAFAGFRCMEIANLLREDIWEQAEPPLVIARGKSGKERTVPLHPSVMSALRRHGLPRHGPVFRRDNGEPWTPEQVSQRGNKFLHGLGIPSTMHQLRHWFATHVLRTSNGDIRVVQELLGHASLANTQIYAAFYQPRAADAVAALSVGAREPPPHERAATDGDGPT